MFTVVIPLFQKRGFIQRALDSVYAQSLDAAAAPEIVVVNDGSTDGGDAVARSQADLRVRVIDQPNRGVSAARNAGIAAAGQPFIAFLDADDRWQPGFLARMRDLIAACPGGTMYGSGFTTVRQGRPQQAHGIRASDLEPAQAAGAAVAGRIDFFRAMRREFVTNSSSIVVPKSAALGVGGFAEGVTHGEDHLFWTKLALAGPVVLTAEPLTEYDVSVPGQAVEYWQQGYTQRFDVLEFHRYLAAELGRRPADGVGVADRSFAAYARGELRTAVLQRLYWGNFPAVDRLWRELALARLGLGPAAATAAWLAGHGWAQPPAAFVLRAIRSIRVAARGSVAGGRPGHRGPPPRRSLPRSP